MRTWRVLSTAGLVVAIGGCAATVVAFAAAQPRDKHDSAASPLSTPSSSYADEATPTLVVPSSASATHPAARPKTTASSTRPATSAARTSHPSAPSPTTKAAPPAKPASTPAAPRGQSLPLGYSTGSATRVITVVASSTGSTTATLQAWNKAAGGGWLRYGSAVTAHVGSQGLTTKPNEDKSATPIGSFTLTQAFGALGNPGTGLPYFKTDSADWWVSDRYSKYYNTHYRCSASSCPFNTGAGENLLGAGSVYNYAVVIDANRFPKPVSPNGSAFFFHVTNGKATAGCVAISQSKLVTLMKWLTPSAHPRILIGVA
jgi:L,D-peptidoglycan transpeptidase YkuD (ErfK/YbiS/YcfS/YnhG family)